MKLVTLAIFVQLIIEISGRLRAVPEERYENCDESPSEGFFRSTNLTDLFIEFSLTEDDKVKINANYTFKHPITLKEKLFLRLSGDHWYLGKWQRRFTYTMLDTCQDLFNPTSILYRYFNDVQRCPWELGVRHRKI